MTFFGPNGSDPQQHINALAKDATITLGDALYGGQAMRTRVRQRTDSGVDYQGAPFAPYSDSYRRQKVARLGKSDTVDLFGLQQHPHMLNTITVQSPGATIGPDRDIDLFAFPQDATIVSLVIPDGPESQRARLHNEGGTFRTRLGTGKGKAKKNGRSTATMPKREFFNATQDDLSFMMFAMDQRRQQRLGIA